MPHCCNHFDVVFYGFVSAVWEKSPHCGSSGDLLRDSKLTSPPPPPPSPSGLLFLSAPLDYETQRFHRLTVRAADRGLPSLSATQTLTVEVGDVNDQSPVFSQSVYNASVAENRDPGEAVIRVSATDSDSGNSVNSSQVRKDESVVLPSAGYSPHQGLLCLCCVLYTVKYSR